VPAPPAPPLALTEMGRSWVASGTAEAELVELAGKPPVELSEGEAAALHSAIRAWWVTARTLTG